MRITRHIAGAAIAAALVVMSACKPSEQAYSEAYRSAVEAREAAYAADSAAYTRIRPKLQLRDVAEGDATVPVATMALGVTRDAGGVAESLKAYSVVAGDFRQSFNARQMRERLAAGGYPGAFVAQSGEPRYYVVTSSHRTLQEAASALQALRADTSVKMRAPMPFILPRAPRK